MQMTLTLDGSETPTHQAALAAFFTALAGGAVAAPVEQTADVAPPSIAPPATAASAPAEAPKNRTRRKAAEPASESLAPPVETPAAAASAPASPPAAMPVPASAATKDDLRAALQAVVDKHGLPAATALLAEHGGRLSAVPESAYANVTAACLAKAAEQAVGGDA